MDRLVSTLIEDKHPIELEVRTETLSELSERIKGGFVFINFTDTQGGTEIGIELDESSKKLTDTILKKDIGTLKIVGTCEINYHKVKCHAEINLKTRQGLGYLELIDDRYFQ
ncbi:MAG: hypothetical protein BGO67_04135 [Alphaproteobacteria bacterium 41-28]|nr:MAG: hypothetical protein BGO67_04135 [Alphaproteobacteria bacterium 41-28]